MCPVPGTSCSNSCTQLDFGWDTFGICQFVPGSHERGPACRPSDLRHIGTQRDPASATCPVPTFFRSKCLSAGPRPWDKFQVHESVPWSPPRGGSFSRTQGDRSSASSAQLEITGCRTARTSHRFRLPGRTNSGRDEKSPISILPQIADSPRSVFYPRVTALSTRAYQGWVR
jgi:hypothetical protein